MKSNVASFQTWAIIEKEMASIWLLKQMILVQFRLD